MIEIDRDLAEAMRADSRATGPGLRVHVEDVLDTDFEKLRGDGPPLRVVGNLPYNISTPVLFRLLEPALRHRRHALHAAEGSRGSHGRRPGGKEYGRLTVMLGVYAEAERLFDVGPGAFKPPPKVWSAVIRVRPTRRTALRHRQRCGAPYPGHRGVLHRRKTLRNGLKGFLRESDIESCGIDPERRPETLEPARVRTTRGALLSKRRHSLTQSGRIVPHSVILRIGWPIIEKCWCCWICPRAARKCSTPRRDLASHSNASLVALHVVDYVPVEPMGETLMPSMAIEQELVERSRARIGRAHRGLGRASGGSRWATPRRRFCASPRKSRRI